MTPNDPIKKMRTERDINGRDVSVALKFWKGDLERRKGNVTIKKGYSHLSRKKWEIGEMGLGEKMERRGQGRKPGIK